MVNIRLSLPFIFKKPKKRKKTEVPHDSETDCITESQNETASRNDKKDLEVDANCTDLPDTDDVNNHGATANVSDIPKLQETPHGTGNNVDGTDQKKTPPFANEKQRKDSKAKAYQQLGNAATENNEYEKAVGYYRKAHEMSPDLKANETEVTAYQTLGYSHLQAGQYQESIQYYSDAVNFAKQREDKKRRLNACLGLGSAFNNTGNFKASQNYYIKALTTAKSLDDKCLEKYAHTNLGHLYYKHCMFNDAVKSYLKAQEIFNDHGDTQQEINACLMLGHTFRQLAQHEKAVEQHEKAVEQHEKAVEQREKAVEQREKAVKQREKAVEQHEKAVEQHEKAVEQHEKAVKQREKAVEYYEKAVEYYEKAVEYCEKALSIKKEQKGERMQKNRDQKSIINEWCGYCYRFIPGKQEEAIRSYERAKEIAKQDGGKYQEYRANQAIGNILWKTDNFKAKNYYEEALENAKELSDKYCEGTSYLGLAAVGIKEYDYEIAREWYEKALVIFETKHIDHILKGKALAGLGIVWFNLGNTQKSIESFQKARKSANEKTDKGTSVLLKWETKSIIHRQKFVTLIEYARAHPEKVQEIGGVSVCCSNRFLIGRGSDGTRVYVGLGNDGVEKAVKRLRRDVCSSLAEQEKNILNKLTSRNSKSKNVVNYWFSDYQSDKDYLFLILDLCEETLENFVNRSSKEDLVRYAPDIIQQVLKGLVDLHCDSNPVLHRDLKPSNVLRDIKGNWLLADFGISHILKEHETTHVTMSRGTEFWKAVESCSFPKAIEGHDKVRYKKESDIQVAGMVAFYIITKGGHPYGEKPDRLRNLLDGKPVGLDTLKDEAAKDLIAWMLSYDPKERPTAEEALKHPYLQPPKQQFEMLCTVGNQQEIKTGDNNSPVVRDLNNDSTDWRTLMKPDVLKYLCTDFLNGKPKIFHYKSSWTECLRLIRNVNQHWHDRPRPKPQPGEAFYQVGDPQKFFLNLFPSLPVKLHRIIRSSDWKERDELKEYFI